MDDQEQLLLEAFETALEQLDSPLPEPLQAKLNHLRKDPTASVSEFDALAESYAPLKQHYEQACVELVRHGGQRKQFLASNGQSNLTQATQPQSNGSTTPSEVAVPTPPPEPTPAPLKQPNRQPSSNQTSPKIYRFFLPAGATAAEQRKFQQDVELIKQANPNWVVSPDRPMAGETDAIVLIYNDENYLTHHAGYIATRTLADISNRLFAPGL